MFNAVFFVLVHGIKGLLTTPAFITHPSSLLDKVVLRLNIEPVQHFAKHYFSQAGTVYDLVVTLKIVVS